MPRRTPLLCLLALLCTAAGPATRPATAPAKPGRVVFLLDASGSMMNKFDAVRREARRRIDGLAPGQTFVIVSIVGDGPVASSRALVPATDANKRAGYDFLEHEAPHGATDPVPAFREIAVLQPDEIWFLTDGDFDPWPALLAEIRRWPRRPRVNTTLEFAEGQSREKLAALSRETGGVCLDPKP